MKILLLLFFPCIAHADYRPTAISALTPQAVYSNFEKAAIQTNKKLDKFGNDTVYGRPTFNKGAVFSSTVTLPARDKITFGNELHNSSSTAIPEYSTSQTTFATCVTGSTLTITTAGISRVRVTFTGTGSENIGPGCTDASFKVDGAKFNGESGYSRWCDGTADWRGNISFSVLTGVLSAGSHSFCLDIRAWSTGTSTLYNDATHSNQFSVEELR